MATTSGFTGLSPLARGTLDSRNSLPVALAVYPRWRGEHAFLPHFLYYLFGLSPLARGTLYRLNMLEDNNRFIPAGAGNTAPANLLGLSTTVYPRWRGEHTKHTYLFLNNFISHQQSTN